MQQSLCKYQPRLKGRRWTTKVTDGNNNLGIDDQQQFKSAVAMLTTAAHEWVKPRLFHVVLKGATDTTYRELVALFCRQVRHAGDRVEYRMALEVDQDKGRHAHVMFVIGTNRPYGLINSRIETDSPSPSVLCQVVRKVRLTCPSLAYKVCRPATQAMCFIELSRTSDEQLNEACEYISYIFKRRSKPVGQRYFSSRTTRRKAPDPTYPPFGLTDAALTVSSLEKFVSSIAGWPKKAKKGHKTRAYHQFEPLSARIDVQNHSKKRNGLGVKPSFIAGLQSFLSRHRRNMHPPHSPMTEHGLSRATHVSTHADTKARAWLDGRNPL